MFLHQKRVQCTYCVYIVLQKPLCLWDTGKVRDRCGGTGWFKSGLRCKRWVNSVTINVIR